MAATHPDKLKLLCQLSRRDTIFSIARLPQSNRAFVGSSDFKVYEVDLADPKGEGKVLGAHQSYVTGVTLAGSTLVSGSYDGHLIWWDVEKKAQLRSELAHQKWIRDVIATRNGKVVASIADDMVCRLWDAATGKKLHELKAHKEKTPHHFPSMLYAVTFSADDKYVATGDKVGQVYVWEVATGKKVGEVEAPVMYTWDPVQRVHSIGGIRSLAFSPDGKSLAVGGMGKVGNIDHLEGKARIEVFDWASGKRTHEFADNKVSGLVNHLVFHPEGAWLLGAGGAGAGFFLFFDLNTKKSLRVEDKVPMHVHDVVLNETADTIYAVGNGKIAVYEMKG